MLITVDPRSIVEQWDGLGGEEGERSSRGMDGEGVEGSRTSSNFLALS